MKLTTQLKIVCENLNEAEMQVGGDFESDLLRVHRFSDNLHVTDVVNAGKRGKKCRVISVYARIPSGDRGAPLYDITLQIKDKTTYDELKKIILDATEKDPRLSVNPERDERGVDVIPTSLKPFSFENEHIRISADLNGFSVGEKNDPNETKCISTDDKTGKRGVKKFYEFLTKNPEVVKNMTFSDILNLLRKLDIGWHQYCALD